MQDIGAFYAMGGVAAVLGAIGVAVISGSSGVDEGSYQLGFFEKRTVKSEVRERLKDPSSAEFGTIKAAQDGHIITVCGFVNAKNSYGAYTGRKPFYGMLTQSRGFSVIALGGSEGEVTATFTICERRGIKL
ncbi:hypothetical protein [Tropicibacter sp. S64]|uniref:hypothetical protein n=1 Tax=Tropicibacter sp. S64 TaxID=3415122 RepID=UPI003C79A3C1